MPLTRAWWFVVFELLLISKHSWFLVLAALSRYLASGAWLSVFGFWCLDFFSTWVVASVLRFWCWPFRSCWGCCSWEVWCPSTVLQSFHPSLPMFLVWLLKFSQPSPLEVRRSERRLRFYGLWECCTLHSGPIHQFGLVGTISGVFPPQYSWKCLDVSFSIKNICSICSIKNNGNSTVSVFVIISEFLRSTGNFEFCVPVGLLHFVIFSPL